MANVLEFLSALDSSAITTAADLNNVANAAAGASSAAASASARTGGAAGSGEMGGTPGPLPGSHTTSGKTGGSGGGGGPGFGTTTVTALGQGVYGSPNDAARLIAELRSLQRRGSGSRDAGQIGSK